MSSQEFVEGENEENSSYERTQAFDEFSELVLLTQSDPEVLAEALYKPSGEQLDRAMYVLENHIDSIIQDSLESDDTSVEYFINNSEDLETALVNREAIRVMRYQREKDN